LLIISVFRPSSFEVFFELLNEVLDSLIKELDPLLVDEHLEALDSASREDLVNVFEVAIKDFEAVLHVLSEELFLVGVELECRVDEHFFEKLVDLIELDVRVAQEVHVNLVDADVDLAFNECLQQTVDVLALLQREEIVYIVKLAAIVLQREVSCEYEGVVQQMR